MTVRMLTGDCRALLATLPDASVQCCVGKNDGRFKKGERHSPATEFKPGTHWREPKPYYDRDWLIDAYVTQGQSAAEIGALFGVSAEAVTFWLKKHNLPRRSISEARSRKHWGAAGESNPMFGKRGAEVGNWKGGITPERQSFYSSLSWSNAVKAVWKRDQATCQRCGKRSGLRGKFHIHHIVSFAVVALRAEPSNLVLLCPGCHRFVHSRKNTTGEYIKKGGAE